jgi:drug/metabolite transporter (DMT)-like permease
LVLFPFARNELALSSAQTVALAAMGVVQLGIPYFLFSKGLEKISLQEASLIVLVEPVLNPIWVALAVGETPSSATLAGGALILFGLGYRYFQQWALDSKLRAK